MTKAYEQSGQMFETFLNQAPGLPEEGKKAVKDWMSAYRTGCNDYKKIVDDHYAKVEEYFAKEQIQQRNLSEDLESDETVADPESAKESNGNAGY